MPTLTPTLMFLTHLLPRGVHATYYQDRQITRGSAKPADHSGTGSRESATASAFAWILWKPSRISSSPNSKSSSRPDRMVSVMTSTRGCAREAAFPQPPERRVQVTRRRPGRRSRNNCRVANRQRPAAGSRGVGRAGDPRGVGTPGSSAVTPITTAAYYCCAGWRRQGLEESARAAVAVGDQTGHCGYRDFRWRP